MSGTFKTVLGTLQVDNAKPCVGFDVHDCNVIRTHNLSVGKRALNHLANWPVW